MKGEEILNYRIKGNKNKREFFEYLKLMFFMYYNKI